MHNLGEKHVTLNKHTTHKGKPFLLDTFRYPYLVAVSTAALLVAIDTVAAQLRVWQVS